MQRVSAGENGELFEGVDHRRGIAHHRLPRHQAGEADSDGNVEHGADEQAWR